MGHDADRHYGRSRRGRLPAVQEPGQHDPVLRGDEGELIPDRGGGGHSLFGGVGLLRRGPGGGDPGGGRRGRRREGIVLLLRNDVLREQALAAGQVARGAGAVREGSGNVRGASLRRAGLRFFLAHQRREAGLVQDRHGIALTHRIALILAEIHDAARRQRG